MLGQIIFAAIAIGLSVWLGPQFIAAAQGLLAGAGTAVVAGSATAIGGGILGGAAIGVASSVVSQGIGVATGLQDRFSWKGVALAGIAGGISGGITGLGQGLTAAGTITTAAAKAGGALSTLGRVGKFLGGGGFISGAARGVVSSVMTQGIAVATGLQSKFSWSGVAVGAVVGGTVGVTNFGGVGGRIVSGMAGALAGAATRSLIDGSDFGDNVLAALPDVIGNIVGNLSPTALPGVAIRSFRHETSSPRPTRGSGATPRHPRSNTSPRSS